jgi:hypothetical protein
VDCRRTDAASSFQGLQKSAVLLPTFTPSSTQPVTAAVTSAPKKLVNLEPLLVILTRQRGSGRKSREAVVIEAYAGRFSTCSAGAGSKSGNELCHEALNEALTYVRLFAGSSSTGVLARNGSQRSGYGQKGICSSSSVKAKLLRKYYE